jgi:hypothetical protein
MALRINAVNPAAFGASSRTNAGRSGRSVSAAESRSLPPFTLSLEFNWPGRFDIGPPRPRKLEGTSRTIGNLYQRKLKPPWPFRLKERTLLTASTQFPNRELGSSIRSLAPGARPRGKMGYLIGSSRRMLDRLKAAAVEFVLIAILVAGFIVAALLALDLSDVLEW